MNRGNIVPMATVVLIAMAFISGAALPIKTVEEKAKETPRPLPAIGQRMGFLNFPRVMKEYRRAIVAVQRLRDRREGMIQNVVGLREMLRALQAMPKAQDPHAHEDIGRQTVLLTRQIEDMGREIDRLVNSQASLVIAELYDEIHSVSTEIAHERGLSVLFAYPDVTNAEDQEKAEFKELKLKPSAALPFVMDPALDYTDELIERLNARFAIEEGKK